MDFNYLLVEKAASVISIDPVSDSQPTIQDNIKIMERIWDEDSSFARLILNQKWGISFSFGDKYFLPINDTKFLCIPLKVENLRAWLSENFSESKDVIEQDFNSMKPKMKKSGYFKVD